jgi:hypothetical protein
MMNHRVFERKQFWSNRGGTILAFAWNQDSWCIAKIHTGYLLSRGRAYALNKPAQ